MRFFSHTLPLYLRKPLASAPFVTHSPKINPVEFRRPILIFIPAGDLNPLEKTKLAEAAEGAEEENAAEAERSVPERDRPLGTLVKHVTGDGEKDPPTTTATNFC